MYCKCGKYPCQECGHCNCPEWIKCSERLPDKDIPVLCFDGTYIEVAEYWYDENDKPVFFNPPAPPKDFIIFWMPLPEPPKE